MTKVEVNESGRGDGAFLYGLAGQGSLYVKIDMVSSTHDVDSYMLYLCVSVIVCRLFPFVFYLIVA